MLNLNSPTVQSMLKNTPNGFGNIPVYYGNTPTITSTIEAVPTQSATPFPSPKEMVMNTGQNTLYSQTTFTPRNVVGAYNPGFQAAFAGYSNPYMGYGTYGAYNNQYCMAPPDQESRDMLETAINNGLTYDEQLINESNLYKTMSRIVSKNLGRSEEEAKRCEEVFSIYCKYPQQEYAERKKVKFLHIKLKIGDEVVADIDPDKTFIREQNYTMNTMYIYQMRERQHFIECKRIETMNSMYEKAPERMFDNYDLLDFFNIGAGVIMADSLNRELYMQSIRRTAQVYDSDDFKKRLLKNNGLRSREQLKAVERFVGRYGIMPDGRPVSPAHDPAVATSFSYDARTGQYTVTAPNFIRDKLEEARDSFIKSIDYR